MSQNTPKNLVIVESPTKAKTIKKFLSKDFKVESSYGHVRDLPEKKIGIDIKDNFKPEYVILPKAKKIISRLQAKAKQSEVIYFATDEDREGEAIAWHLLQALGLDQTKELKNSRAKEHTNSAKSGSLDSKVAAKEIKRIVFHEITEKAIKQALANPRSIDQKLVDAQQARRILDRLVGYELSPFLWRKVARGLSAGRVQSVAVRLIVEKEEEIKNFKPEEYWVIIAELKPHRQPQSSFTARLYAEDGKVLPKLAIKNQEQARQIVKTIENSSLSVSKIESKKITRSPQPPFTTSTLQQEANNKLGFSAKQTMLLAQQLYEGVALGDQGLQGLITYMRTDSVHLSDEFLSIAQLFIKQNFGNDYVLSQPIKYKTKNKTAQEAHEAIRPTNVWQTPQKVKPFLDKNQFKLYDLIWRRSVACQLPPAQLETMTVDIAASKYTLRAKGQTIKFDGFLRLYPDTQKETLLPPLQIGEKIELIRITPQQKFTEPPPRYTEASLVKKLEELGIGRPSTYAPIISTIQERNYVTKEGRALKPTDIAVVVNSLLVGHFPKIIDYKFTATLEKELDEIAEGKLAWQPVIKEFYKPFKENLQLKEKTITKDDTINEKTDEKCDKCGAPMVIKTSRYGKFLACTAYPKCRNAKSLNNQTENKELRSIQENCPDCGQPLQIKYSRFGEFIGCSNYPQCKFVKPIEKSTNVTCPDCQQGEILERRTRRKKIFFSCARYPDCQFALWQKPTGEKCSRCGSLIVEVGKDKIKCSSKECPAYKQNSAETEKHKNK